MSGVQTCTLPFCEALVRQDKDDDVLLCTLSIAVLFRIVKPASDMTNTTPFCRAPWRSLLAPES